VGTRLPEEREFFEKASTHRDLGCRALLVLKKTHGRCRSPLLKAADCHVAGLLAMTVAPI
jgi:hypothetical protein